MKHLNFEVSNNVALSTVIKGNLDNRYEFKYKKKHPKWRKTLPAYALSVNRAVILSGYFKT